MMNNIEKKKTVIIKGYDSYEVEEVLSQMVSEDLWADRRYREIPKEMDKIFEKYPKVDAVFDWKKPEDLTKEEVEALLKILELEEEMADIEKKILVEAAQREAVSLFSRKR